MYEYVSVKLKQTHRSPENVFLEHLSFWDFFKLNNFIFLLLHSWGFTSGSGVNAFVTSMERFHIPGDTVRAPEEPLPSHCRHWSCFSVNEVSLRLPSVC